MIILVWILFGLVGAISFITLTRIQPKQESQILAIGLVVAALIYIGFAIGGGANQLWIVIEVAGVGVYGLLAVLGLRYSNWWLMLGWMAHPLWDIGLHLVNQGAVFTPAWYVVVCVSFDLLVASYITGVQLNLFNLRKPDYES
ncbi:DUF6010 family protein [Anabaena catenula]|uniref:Integral membrane protein n=1 Tax=Anabaena catenula FACHB-362 TaxID=2692877 RepID=A0ABR8J8L0_9NOST|nr:DUF6010 family protein [Anabaena catenula]MBD2693988.1 hypothetical protein [Anabaena catenula FACHB-362]